MARDLAHAPQTWHLWAPANPRQGLRYVFRCNTSYLVECCSVTSLKILVIIHFLNLVHDNFFSVEVKSQHVSTASMTARANLIAQTVLDQFDKLPAKRKPAVRNNGIHEWVPLSGIVAERNGTFTCIALAYVCPACNMISL